jgi:hypothetical protein
MEEQSLKDTYVKETLIGIAAASFSIVVIVALMEGGGRTAFADAFTLLLFGYVAPFIFLPAAPWLVILYAAAGVALYQQYRRVPPRFMRYLVGAEVIVWQLVGFWLIAKSFVH